MTFYILANPHSGAHKGARILEILLAQLNKDKESYKLFATQKSGQEASLMKEILSEIQETDFLVIIGGDGTASLAVNALPAGQAFSYIPAGSGNDFARSLGLPFDPVQAYQAIKNRQAHEFFIIKYQSDLISGYALNNIGIGLDAAIVDATNHSTLKKVLNKIHFGSLSYLLTALHVLIRKKAFSISVSPHLGQHSPSDEEKPIQFDRAFLMTFTKHPYFGGGIKIAPDASNLTEKIELVEFDKHSLLKTFSLIPKVLKATHLQTPEFAHFVSPNFTLELQDTQFLQIDGEISILPHNIALTLNTEKRTIIY